MPSVHVLVSGKVQGVFYRKNTQETATKLKLVGWVKNLDDGRVELKAFGPKEDLEKLVQWCQKGPRLAKVEKVTATLGDDDGSAYTSFVVDK